MFDFSFSELMVVAVVALIVVGPERLPKVARTAGHLLGRLQRYVNDVKSDIKREIQLEDLQKLQEQVSQQARELELSMRQHVNVVEAELHKVEGDLSAQLSDASKNEDTDAQPDVEPEPAEPDPQLPLDLKTDEQISPSPSTDKEDPA